MKQQILQHLESILGTGSQLIAASGDVEVRAWSGPGESDPRTLATVGMALKSQTVPKGKSCPSRGPRTELIMSAGSHDAPALAELLLTLAGYPKQAGSFLHWWHTLPLGRPIVPRSALTHVYLTFPFLKSEEATFHAGKVRVDLVWVVPITDGEFALFEAKGPDALEERMEEAEVVIADLMRPSAV
jgi:hypothetical protein